MQQRSVIVLGAGMVGTCTAVHLALRGHHVTLVDRREPGQETSYGNAGIIQREAVEPYAFPQDWATLAQVAMKRGAAVNYHLAALPPQARALAGYWANSRPQRHADLSVAYARLIEHALTEHQALMDLAAAGNLAAAAGAAAAGKLGGTGDQAGDLVRREGYLCVFREEKTMHEAVVRAGRLVQRYGPEGLRHAVLDADALSRAEPGLRRRLAGALHWLDPWSVNDPGQLVGGRYAALLARYGARFMLGDAATLQPTVTGWRVRTGAGEIDAEHVVVALGPWSDTLLQGLGYRYPLFVKRGYHCHYRGAEGPRLPVLDADGGLVLAPMQRGLRLTTGAEFALVDAPPTPVQLQRAEVLARQLYVFGEPVEPAPWVGARPCTADMLPVIGPAPRHRGLWFNFGHAHQGFTLGPVSGRLMAELIEGSAPVVDPVPYAPARFGR